jgi:MFS family permease
VKGLERLARLTRGRGEGRWLTPGVGGVGAASFFSDSGHEIATAVLPSFLVAVLHASAGVLGLIEGLSDALMGLMKLIGGPLADDDATRRRLASGGYLGTALASGAIGLVVAPWQAGVLRALGWMSRGLRSPARDSLLASLAPAQAYGRAFGLERAGDNLGAVVGPLAAAGLVAALGVRPALLFAFVPGIFAALAIAVAAREARRRPSAGRRLQIDLAGLLSAGVLRPLVPIAAFELGNVATTLLILRATELLRGAGRTAAAATTLAILLYAAHNAFASLVALAGGHWIDRGGPRAAFGTGALLYAAAYVCFALPWHSWPPVLIAFALAGSGIGLAETAESALFAALLPDRLRGSGFGLLGGVQSLGDFASSAAVGLLYAGVSAGAGFGYAAAWMAVSLAATSLIGPRRTGTARPSGSGP